MTDHIYWKNGVLNLLDQRELPFRKTYVKCRTAGDVITAINNMNLSGARRCSAIVAAYGMVLGVKEVVAAKRSVRRANIDRIAKKLGATRPTAVNLFWALRIMTEAFEGHAGDRDIAEDMLGEALLPCRGHREQQDAFPLRAELIEKGDTIMTHCNAGRLPRGATARRSASCAPPTRRARRLRSSPRKRALTCRGRA
jgi:methylthioribose-1-phosphate isomerase